MRKYIDSEKLFAEIELLLKRNEPYCGNDVADGQRQALYQVKDFITSLQQEQDHFAEASKMESDVDLEKAFAHEYAIYHLPNFIVASIVNGTELIDFIYETARHFYEFGLNARK